LVKSITSLKSEHPSKHGDWVENSNWFGNFVQAFYQRYRLVLSSKRERFSTDLFLHPTASDDRLAPFIYGARALD
jgi:hypothetical protein